MKSYKIKNWESTFETAETRKLENLRWVPTPNKHDGLGYRTIVAEPDRCELFSAWNLILQTASKARRPERGSLCRDGRWITARDLSLMTGFPESIFTRALSFFSTDVQWLIAEELSESIEMNGNINQSPAQAGSDPAHAGNDPARPDRQKEVEKRAISEPKLTCGNSSLGFLPETEKRQKDSSQVVNVEQSPAQAGSDPAHAGNDPAEWNGREGNRRELNTPIIPKSHLPTTPVAKRIAELFSRRLSTAWAEAEVRTFKKLNIAMEDMDVIEPYYAEQKSRGDEGHHRRDLKTFLNNFHGEMDRARAFQRATEPSLERKRSIRDDVDPAEYQMWWQQRYPDIVDSEKDPKTANLKYLRMFLADASDTPSHNHQLAPA